MITAPTINSIAHGDALTALKTLPDSLVQCCVTSPPYYGLRDYGVEGQIGLEETPQAYVAKLVEVFREVRRVLKDDGTLWLNIGDSYAGSMKGMGTDGKAYGGPKQQSNKGSIGIGRPDWSACNLKPKDLIGIPWRVAFALQADGWYLRSDIVWHKLNAMPESVKDRPTKAHEYIFLLAKSERYYYDADAVREPNVDPPRTRSNKKYTGLYEQGDKWARTKTGLGKTQYNPLGRNRRTIWSVDTSPYKGAHFAVMPTALVEPCILAGSRSNDVILDPFCGAGTVPLVALQHNRRYIGIELNAEYIALAKQRIATVARRVTPTA